MIAAFAAAQLGGVFHLGLTRHEVCSAHGELIEGPADEGTSGDHGAPSSSTRVELHEHCPLLVQPGDRATPPPNRCPEPLVTAAAWPTWHLATRAPATVAVLAFAPKTSPPA